MKYTELLQSQKQAFDLDLLATTLSDGINTLRGEMSDRPIVGNPRVLDLSSTQQVQVPQDGIEFPKLIKTLMQRLRGNPAQSRFYAHNAIPQSANSAIIASSMAAVINPSPIWHVIGPASVEAEMLVNAMMADLLGFQPSKAGGYFSYSGTGGNEAGIRIGREKASPGTRNRGMYERNYVITADACHFSIDSVVSDMGIGAKNIIKLKGNDGANLDIDELKEALYRIIADKGKVAAIIPVLGTTDGFCMDDIQDIVNVRDEAVRQYKLGYRPHMHVDAAMGGLFAVFNKYDFDANPLGFESKLLSALRKMSDKTRQVQHADSVVIDFHKLGYAPFLSSLFMVKDANDFALVDRIKNHGPYPPQAETYLSSWAKECSRPFNSLAVYANLLSFGLQGYQAMLANLVSNTLYFREQLSRINGVAILNEQSNGPLTTFRVTPNEEASLDKINQRTEQVFKEIDAYREKLFLGRTVRYATASDGKGVYGIKVFFINPFTTHEDIDKVYIPIIKKGIQQAGNS
jgi:glutamate/tyrosine decarboxylase-like PLP-dependent enzyme